MKALITGAGSIALRHVANLKKLKPECDITVVSSATPLRLPFEEFAVNQAFSVQEALERVAPGEFDLAVICSQSVLHGSELDELMATGCAVYIEKPVVIDSHELARVKNRLSGGWSAASVVGCNLRYHGAVKKLKALLAQGAAGQVVRASLSVGQWLPDWRPDRNFSDSYSRFRSQGGGVIYDLVHELDCAIHLFGLIDSGQAVAGRMTDLTADADDSATMSLLMQSGLPVQVSLDYVARQPVREYTVVGTRGTLTLNFHAKRLTLANELETQIIELEDSEWRMDLTYLAAMQDLLNAMQNNTETSHGLSDAIHTTEWMLKLEANALRGKNKTKFQP